MIYGEMNPKKVKVIKEFLGKRKVLIVETKKTTRTTLKKILVDLGVKVSNIFVAENISDACQVISDERTEIVFAGYELSDNKGIEILDTHQQFLPNRQHSIFTLISGPNSIASSCLVLDTEADAFIAEPFTSKSLTDSFLKTVERKIVNTPFINSYHKIKEFIYLKKFEEAKQKLEPLKDGVDHLDEVYYLEGKINFEENNIEESLKLFETALEVNHAHYPSLKILSDEYTRLSQWKKAYVHTTKLLKHYPINPERLPSLIRLSIANQKYEDLIEYADFFRSLDVQSPSIKTNIAAGLVICSKYFLKNNEKDKGKKTILEAVKCSSGKISIIENIILTLIQYKEVRLAIEVLKQFEPLHGEKSAFKNLEIQIDFCNKDTNSVLKKGLPLAESGDASEKVFEAVILSSIKAQRKTNSIIHLIDKAVAKYPGSSNLFQSMYKE